MGHLRVSMTHLAVPLQVEDSFLVQNIPEQSHFGRRVSAPQFIHSMVCQVAWPAWPKFDLFQPASAEAYAGTGVER